MRFGGFASALLRDSIQPASGRIQYHMQALEASQTVNHTAPIGLSPFPLQPLGGRNRPPGHSWNFSLKLLIESCEPRFVDLIQKRAFLPENDRTGIRQATSRSPPGGPFYLLSGYRLPLPQLTVCPPARSGCSRVADTLGASVVILPVRPSRVTDDSWNASSRHRPTSNGSPIFETFFWQAR